MSDLLIASYQFAQIQGPNDTIAYQFITDNQVVYRVLFVPDSGGDFAGLSFSDNAVQIIIGPAPGSILPPGIDKRITITLGAIFAHYAKLRPQAIPFYICSEKDGQEAARARKFMKAFTSGNTEEIYKQAVFDKNRYKGAFIYKAGHPAEAEILAVAAKWSQ